MTIRASAARRRPALLLSLLLALVLVLAACAETPEEEDVAEPDEDVEADPEPEEDPAEPDDEEEDVAEPDDGDVEPVEPDGPVELALGTGVGGTPDVVMRAALQCLQEDDITDLDVVVQNREGASWAVMYDFLSEQVGAGDVIGGIAQPLVTTPPTQGIDYWHPDLEPLAMLLAKDVGVVVAEDSEWETLEDFLDYARENPNDINWGGAQVGATSHIVMAMLANAADVEINYVPYDSGGDAQTAFLAGDVDAVQLNPDEAWPLIEAGDARMLAILADERLEAPDQPELEEIPTTAEEGYPEANFRQFMGAIGPPEMPEEHAVWWDQTFAELAEGDCWQTWAEENQSVVLHIPRDELGEYLDEQAEVHREILEELGVAE